jgi:hypothetical protein
MPKFINRLMKIAFIDSFATDFHFIHALQILKNILVTSGDTRARDETLHVSAKGSTSHWHLQRYQQTLDNVFSNRFVISCSFLLVSPLIGQEMEFNKRFTSQFSGSYCTDSAGGNIQLMGNETTSYQ